MINNTVIKLNNHESYYIVAIAPYDGDKYYITNHLSPDATELTEEFTVFKEFVVNNKIELEKITDDNLIYDILNELGFIY